jgi:hypothetical protein
MNERPWNKPPTKSEKATVQQLESILAVAEHIKNENAKLIDELAQVNAEKNKADKREKEIKALLKSLGDGEHKGTKFYIEISTSPRDQFQEKEFKADHPELAKKYTESKPVTTIKPKPLF